MTGLIISTTVLVAALILSLWFYISRKKKQGPAAALSGKGREAMSLLQQWLKELNCTYQVDKDGDDSMVHFDYQSGHFQALLTKDSEVVTLRYLFIYTTELEKLQVARTVCNSLSTRVDMLKLVYSLGREKNEVYVHILADIPLSAGAAGLKELFKEVLTRCFSTQFLFMREFDEEVKRCKEAGTEDFENSLAVHKRALFLLREQEFSHQSVEARLRSDAGQALTLGRLLSVVFNRTGVSLSKLVVTDADGRVQVLTENLQEYDLLSSFIESGSEGSEPTFKESDIMMQVSFSTSDGIRNILLISLRPDGCTDTTCYVRVTCCIPALGTNINVSLGSENNQPHTFSLLVAYDLRPAEKQLQEFEYMWQDAKDKIAAGKEEEMSNEQWLMAGADNVNAAQALYRGSQLMHSGRYYEALLYLENAYDGLQSRFYALGNSQKERFYELCYYIGFCYCELRLYERAYYYLDIVFQLNRIAYTQEYVNCLANAGDFRALYVIDRLLAELQKTENGKEADEEEEDEPKEDASLRNFINFLRRRRGYVLIELGRLDEAEEIFKAMLDEPGNSDYALEELAYIQRLKEEVDKGKEKDCP